MHYREYEQDLLKKVQQCELSILKKFIEVCTKYNISYYIGWGTLIGALRHEGFIPWDDDIDVCMLREDYEKLSKVPAEEWGSEYHIVGPNTKKLTTNLLTRICKKNTTYLTGFINRYQKGYCHKFYENEMFLDIFVMERVSANQYKRKFTILKGHLLKNLFFTASVRLHAPKDAGIAVKAKYAVGKILNSILNGMHFDTERLLTKYLKFVEKSSQVDSNYLVDYRDPDPMKSMILYQDIFPLKTAMFEGMEVSIPNGYDKILRNYYGDYMQLPPVEKRVNHCPAKLAFEDGSVYQFDDE